MDETEPASPQKKKRSRWPFILLVIALLIAGAVTITPYFVKAKSTACKNACINNLRQLDGAKEQYALENKLSPGHVISPEEEKLVYQYIKGGELKCPGGGKYKLNPIDAAPTCDSLKEGGHSLAAP